MTPEEFRIAGHALIDWIADYRAGLVHRPVGTSVAPSAVRHAIPPQPPAHPEALAALLADLDGIVVPAITQVQHPRYFGWFPANASLASVLGDLASSGVGALGISWESAPALTELEEAMVDWLRQLVGLSAAWRGVITDTASTGVLAALLCARERATGFAQEHGGLAATGARLAVYTSEDAHSSVAKAVRLAGFGQDNLRLVPVDPTTRGLRADALREVMDADRGRGWQPAAVVATVGTTATTAIDPVAAIVDAVAAAQPDPFGPTAEAPIPAALHPRPWVHVDAALAGSAMLVPECRSLWAGVEGADSLSWNPHKWLGTVLDCSLFHVRDVEALTRVFGSEASYLRSAADGTVTQFRDWGLPLGRRFRALKVWFHLRLDGAETIRPGSAATWT